LQIWFTAFKELLEQNLFFLNPANINHDKLTELYRDYEITTRFAHQQAMPMLNKSVSRRLRVLIMKQIRKVLCTFGGDEFLFVTLADKFLRPLPGIQQNRIML
jgi:hypothetical protein